jgi:glutathione synthase/RimK-type ligase-like ATP-grasp enzyme
LRPRIALATYEGAPLLAPDDQALVPAFAALGIDAEPAVWSAETVIWETYDAVVVRSCWDYHLRYDEFRTWLERLDASRLPVWNSVALLEWNSHKSYLIDLQQHGVQTVPTIVVRSGGAPAVRAVVRDAGWSRFVVKPAISASGFDTHALDASCDDAAMRTIEQVTSRGDVLVQPFVDEITSGGEYSLIYIDGRFSHSAMKRASGSEFRVQTEHGGSVMSIDVDERMIDAGARVLQALSETPLYARVDGIARGDEFLLMELEMIEPNLFFELKPESAERFASALKARTL